MKVSVLICSVYASRFLAATMASLMALLREAEFHVDVESVPTGLPQTTKRFQRLFDGARGDIIIKSDDDMLYSPGFLRESIAILQNNEDVAYVTPVNNEGMGKPAGRVSVIEKRKDCMVCDHVGGGCWIFSRSLWECVPYSSVTSALDLSFARAVWRKTNKRPACTYYNRVRHLNGREQGKTTEQLA